jgi:hypothetical protein
MQLNEQITTTESAIFFATQAQRKKALAQEECFGTREILIANQQVEIIRRP